MSMARVSPFSPGGLELDLQLVELLGDFLVRNSRGQFVHDAYRTLAQPRSLHVAHLDAIGTGLHIVLGQPPHAPQLAHGS